MWKTNFESLVNLWKNSSINTFVNQTLSNHEKFKGINNLSPHNEKYDSQIHKLSLNRAAGRDENLAVDPSVCLHLSSLFSVCLMLAKIHENAWKLLCTYFQKLVRWH